MAEAEEAQDSSTVKEEIKEVVEEEEVHMESQIQRAMRSRVTYFKDQADSLTFESVRRLLEKDLGLETCALDVHKRFIKQFLFECLNGGDDDNVSKSSAVTVEKNVATSKGEVAESAEKEPMKKGVKEASSDDEEKMEDSPVMGLLTGHEKTKVRTKGTQGVEKKKAPSESTIKEAIKKRASYLKTNSEEITMAGVRKLLEEDLELDKNTLYPFKKFITEQVDEVLSIPKVSEPASGVKKKTSHSKASKLVSSEESSGSLDSKSEEIEDEVKPKKKVAPKRKIQKSEESRKRKRPAKETKVFSKKKSKQAETTVENSDAEAGGNASEDDQSESSAEKPTKKKEVVKEVVTPAYGKRVEYLKSVIKSCGMSVPPAVYKRAKQVSENKREAFLIKELEEILSREGLSTDPSEKEIKEVRKKKDRAKELEGIDMSNIVSSTRRRATTSFVAPPKPKIPVQSDGDDAEGSDSDNDDSDDDDDDDDGDDGDDSQVEDFNEDDDEDSD